MIELDIKPYCHDCPNFVADVEEVATYNFGEPDTYYRKIVCENSRICAGLVRYLKSEMEKADVTSC